MVIFLMNLDRESGPGIFGKIYFAIAAVRIVYAENDAFKCRIYIIIEKFVAVGIKVVAYMTVDIFIHIRVSQSDRYAFNGIFFYYNLNKSTYPLIANNYIV